MSVTVESATKPQDSVVVESATVKEPVAETKKSASVAPEQVAQASDETTEESDVSETVEAKDSDESEQDELSEKHDDAPKGVKKRFDKLTKKISARDQEIAFLRQELANRSQESKPEPKVEAQVSTDSEPNPDDFERHTDYIKAVAKWTANEELKARDVKVKQEELKQNFNKRITDHQARVEEFVKAHQDFDDVIEGVDDIVAQPVIKDLILDSDNGPELMYALASNREEFERINKLNPLAAVREIGKLEARLAKESESPKTEIKTTKAPKPLSPVSAKGGAPAKALKDLDYDEFARVRNEQVRNLRR